MLYAFTLYLYFIPHVFYRLDILIYLQHYAKHFHEAKEKTTPIFLLRMPIFGVNGEFKTCNHLLVISLSLDGNEFFI